MWFSEEAGAERNWTGSGSVSVLHRVYTQSPSILFGLSGLFLTAPPIFINLLWSESTQSTLQQSHFHSPIITQRDWFTPTILSVGGGLVVGFGVVCTLWESGKVKIQSVFSQTRAHREAGKEKKRRCNSFLKWKKKKKSTTFIMSSYSSCCVFQVSGSNKIPNLQRSYQVKISIKESSCFTFSNKSPTLFQLVIFPYRCFQSDFTAFDTHTAQLSISVRQQRSWLEFHFAVQCLLFGGIDC